MPLLFCNICSKRFAWKSDMTEYIGFMVGDVKPYTCNVCDKKFARECHLINHKKEHRKPFTCIVCGEMFRKKSDMLAHLRIHTGEKPFTCSVCNKTFEQKVHMTLHLRKHTGEESPTCIVCDKKFANRSDLTVHLRIHTGERPFVCSICDKNFIRRNDMQVHIREHKGEKPTCDICNKTYRYKSALTRHIQLVHIGATPFTCNVCSKKFARKYLLIKHNIEHTGVSPFTCSICNALFGRKFDLDRHLKVHTGERPFTCNVCNKDFTWKSCLTRHIKSVHGAGKHFTYHVCNNDCPNHGTIHIEKEQSSIYDDSSEKGRSVEMSVSKMSYNDDTGEQQVSFNACNRVASEAEVEGSNVHLAGQSKATGDADEKQISLDACCGDSCKIISSEDEAERSNDQSKDTWDKASVFCKLCGTKYSESWCVVKMDIGSDCKSIFCKQCQHMSIPCVLCDKMVELCLLRTHVGEHMGESVI